MKRSSAIARKGSALSPASVRASANRHPHTGITAALGLATLVFAAFSFGIGPSHLPLLDLVRGLFTGEGVAGTIAREIRAPRAALAVIVGAALGASGAALQGLFRNPLAEPGITGVSACAGLGAVIALYFGIAARMPLALPAFAVAGALLAALILYALARARAGVLALVLAGVAISSLAAALTAFTLSLARNPYAMTEMVLWLMGSLKDRTLVDVAFSAPLVVAGIVILASTRRALDALTLGEDAAASLGVNVAGMRVRVIVGVALATGAATAVAGSVAFVGLVVPHLLRPFYGYAPGRLILPSALGGAALVSIADVVVRVASPPSGELLLGVFTAMIGAPFFLWLILHLRSER